MFTTYRGAHRLSTLSLPVIMRATEGDGVKIEQVLGANIRKFRESQGMSQAALGEALAPLLGKPWERQAVSAAETGKRALGAAEVYALALTLKVRPEWLFRLPAGIDGVELGAETPAPRLDESIPPPGESLNVTSALVRLRGNVRGQQRNVKERVHGLHEHSSLLTELEALLASLEHALTQESQEAERDLPPGTRLNPWGRIVTPSDGGEPEGSNDE